VVDSNVKRYYYRNSMAKNEVQIEFGEVPRIRHTDELIAVAQRIAVSNCAVVIPSSIETAQLGPITDNQRKMNVMVSALNNNRRVRGAWVSGEPEYREQTANGDYGMHTNPYDPAHQSTPHVLRWHHTPIGSTVATFAEIGPEYLANQGRANRRLTELLAEGLTDPRYADPSSFMRAEIGEDESVLFRFDAGTVEAPRPYLHGFETTSSLRVASLADIYRVA
jgi:hypothetical protein